MDPNFITEFLSNIVKFDDIYAMHLTSLDSLDKFTQDSVSSVEGFRSADNGRFVIAKVYPSYGTCAQDLTEYYTREFGCIHELNVRENNLLDKLVQDHGVIYQNCDNPQIVAETGAKLHNCFAKKDAIILYHEEVMWNKHVHYKITRWWL